MFAEYSAENSDPTEFGVDEPLCTGRPRQGHGRGTCQWGTQRWATEESKTFDWIVTHYYPGSALYGVDLEPGAAFVAESYTAELTAGDEAVVWLDYQNLGATTWSPETVFVGTTGPRDRASAFFADGNWVSPSRPSGADLPDGAPGAVGRFSWVMRAPEVDAVTTFTESFGLVTGDGLWFGPADDAVTWTIRVLPRGGGPGDDPDGDGGVDDSGVEGGGCDGGGGGGGGATGSCAILLAGASLLARRSSRAARPRR